ncbi:DNA-binding response regulator, OmpR family, contains REC and winged-helix (wHTH) domain [Dyadobacter koreensis]|uniref:DNA-binding response regulator, OmpR family, contains REC and winged-helix (WHTH) domain n=1 Tax=Dyadobacter koreensis TaxID=408657 RepID=A0A1H6VIU8_9BACT|nr:response regulator transcription factor [Dyadobacter koreensis]SEJ00660.1 DNA-binding response regulator, OmpR family, contains REC and winged-helix (wHTH) domain [Dyadobacter koreensis]
MKILIIEDETELMEVIRQSLEKESFLVESAGDYASALDKIISFDYDCILLDIMLPGGSGLDILQELKNMDKSDNVIIISAKDSLDDKLTGLELGADDYLTKPFHIAELNARIKSVLRRKSFGGKNTVELGNVKLDLDDRTLHINNQPLLLNRKEFDILSYMVVNKNRLVNKTSLAEHVWGDHMDEADDYEFIYSQIKNLRKKLKESQAGIEIQAVYGLGYKLIVL